VDLATRKNEIEELIREKEAMVNEAREKSDAMTESLFATNEQARQLLEEKLKDL
jgi:hypothetical protein